MGTGGVGGYLGGRLAQAGKDVTFIARGKHLEAIRTTGLRVDSICGDFIVHPAKACSSTKEIGCANLIILATKAWNLDEALEQMRPMVGSDSLILPLLNGMEHITLLRSAFGERVLGGLCRISSFIEGPGHVRHVAVQPYIAFGSFAHPTPSCKLGAVLECFTGVLGVQAECPVDIHAAMWHKFIVMSAISGVGAATRKPIGECRSDPTIRTLMLRALEETAAVGVSFCSALAADEAVRMALHRIEMTEPSLTASMHKDIEQGKRSELEAQTGAVIRMGRSKGVPTPTHEWVYEQLLPLELDACKFAAVVPARAAGGP